MPSKLSESPQVVDSFVGKFGYPQSTLLWIGILEITCTLLYVIPRTAILGAALSTGYLGGAMATHVRVSDAFVGPRVRAGRTGMQWSGAPPASRLEVVRPARFERATYRFVVSGGRYAGVPRTARNPCIS